MEANIGPFTTPAGPLNLNALRRRQRELLARAHRAPDLRPAETEEPLLVAQPDIVTPEPTPLQASASLPWHTPGAPALHGLAGDVVRAIAPHTEADPSAVLFQFLAAFGNLLGPGPHCTVESTRHGLNLFVVLVGESSKARKGTSWRHIARLFAELDEPWLTHRVTAARITADGLIHALRDENPATDRRLLILAEEFASILHMLARQKGHLSPLLRSAWDTGDLRTLDRHHPLQATGTHISLIGHITQRELAPLLYRNEAHNGFANRCLWACVRRSQCLPDGGNLAPHDLSTIARDLRRALDWAATAANQPFRRSVAAQQLWYAHYPALSQSRPGVHGAATSRGEAQVLRLSALYAALDCSPVIEEQHLEAALALWDYSAAAAGLVFNIAAEDQVAAVIQRALDASPNGLARDQVRKLFHGHITGERIDTALQQLAALGAIQCQSQPGRGRPATIWETTAPEEETHIDSDETMHAGQQGCPAE